MKLMITLVEINVIGNDISFFKSVRINNIMWHCLIFDDAFYFVGLGYARF